MLEQVSIAIKSQDYRQAAQLLSSLKQQEPNNPWVQFYIGRVYEGTGKLGGAEKIYRQLLKGTTNPKIISQARQGLARLQKAVQEQHQKALAQALDAPGGREPGLLILEPIIPELKPEVAKEFARVMKMDAYTARLQLPSKGWRLYRTGLLGELEYYANALQQANVNCFSASIPAIEELNIFQVGYFQAVEEEATVYCQNQHGQTGKLTFQWSEISKRVEGLVPLFEAVVDTDAKRNLLRKTKTLDYVQFCDLHLPARKSILRLSDRYYKFQEGVNLCPDPQASQPLEQGTIRKNWNNLIRLLNHKLPHTLVWSDFTYFAETSLEFPEMLKRITPHVELFRREESLWDAAFQLYSSLVFLKD